METDGRGDVPSSLSRIQSNRYGMETMFRPLYPAGNYLDSIEPIRNGNYISMATAWMNGRFDSIEPIRNGNIRRCRRLARWPRFNRTDTEWKPLIGIITRHLPADSIEPIRNGNGLNFQPSFTIARFNRTDTEWKLALGSNSRILLPDSIEPIRNGNETATGARVIVPF